MLRRLHVNQDFFAGLMFLAVGAFALWLARHYPLGSVLRMGPGYVPTLLAWGLVALGAMIALRGLLAGGAALTRWHLRPLVLITLAVLAFAAAIGSWGLVAATSAVVVVSALGGREFRPLEVLGLAAALAAGAVGLFVYALKLPIAVWPF